ncbi:hypothetical protein ACB098_09G173700 [Castanea mollissima]
MHLTIKMLLQDDRSKRRRQDKSALKALKCDLAVDRPYQNVEPFLLSHVCFSHRLLLASFSHRLLLLFHSKSAATPTIFRLDVYIHDYLVKRDLKASKQAFQAEGKVSSDPVAIDAPGGFLFEWWSVFWDIFIA